MKSHTPRQKSLAQLILPRACQGHRRVEFGKELEHAINTPPCMVPSGHGEKRQFSITMRRCVYSTPLLQKHNLGSTHYLGPLPGGLTFIYHTASTECASAWHIESFVAGLKLSWPAGGKIGCRVTSRLDCLQYSSTAVLAPLVRRLLGTLGWQLLH